MSNSSDDSNANLDDVIVPHDDALPDPVHTGHAKRHERVDEHALQLATEQERVDAGIADYAPDLVPPATDPVPPGASEEAERAQRGLNDDGDADQA